jgi:hypothetical protein
MLSEPGERLEGLANSAFPRGPIWTRSESLGFKLDGLASDHVNVLLEE